MAATDENHTVWPLCSQQLRQWMTRSFAGASQATTSSLVLHDKNNSLQVCPRGLQSHSITDGGIWIVSSLLRLCDASRSSCAATSSRREHRNGLTTKATIPPTSL